MKTPFDIYDTTDRQLADLASDARADLAMQKQYIAAIDEEITRRQSDTAANLLSRFGKATGSMSFSYDGMKYKAEVPKTVTWDSDKLQAIAASLPWEYVSKVFDIKFSVPERTYAALMDPELQRRIDEARTTKIGDLKVSFVGFDVGNGERT